MHWNNDLSWSEQKSIANISGIVHLVIFTFTYIFFYIVIPKIFQVVEMFWFV